jgi:hypothetical protein
MADQFTRPPRAAAVSAPAARRPADREQRRAVADALAGGHLQQRPRSSLLSRMSTVMTCTRVPPRVASRSGDGAPGAVNVSPASVAVVTRLAVDRHPARATGVQAHFPRR